VSPERNSPAPHRDRRGSWSHIRTTPKCFKVHEHNHLVAKETERTATSVSFRQLAAPGVAIALASLASMSWLHLQNDDTTLLLHLITEPEMNYNHITTLLRFNPQVAPNLCSYGNRDGSTFYGYIPTQPITAAMRTAEIGQNNKRLVNSH
jgi:hypothetical protein